MIRIPHSVTSLPLGDGPVLPLSSMMALLTYAVSFFCSDLFLSCIHMSIYGAVLSVVTVGAAFFLSTFSRSADAGVDKDWY